MKVILCSGMNSRNAWNLILTIAFAVALVSCGGGGGGREGGSTLTTQTPIITTQTPVSTTQTPIITTQTPISIYEPTDSTDDNNTSVDSVKITATAPAKNSIYDRHSGQGDITLTVNNSIISTTGDNATAILVLHSGDGNIGINARGSTVTTEGSRSRGIMGWHIGTGDITIDVGNVDIMTNADDVLGHGIFGFSYGAGNLKINAHEGSTITTIGDQSHGILGYHSESDKDNDDITIDVQDAVITTKGDESYGIIAGHFGTGEDIDVAIDVRDSIVTTMGMNSHGIIAFHKQASSKGEIDINVQGGTVTTMGIEAHGVYGQSKGTGDVTINVRDVTIMTESTGLHPTYGNTFSIGFYGNHENVGNLDINAYEGSTITTMGVNSHAIMGRHTGDGDIAINAHKDSTITTTGAGAHGIVADHYGTMDSRSIAVTIGGKVSASGMNAHGVRIGRVNAQGEVERAAGVDMEGYRSQTVSVDGPVWGGSGEAAGVFLTGGGRVYIGPNGSVGADSGIAILATGDTPVTGSDALKPKLYLDMQLDGRPMANVIDDDWIINDGGETTIMVNNVKLHDGVTGATSLTAANGAWNVMMREEGVKVDRSDPANWVVSNPASGVIADRDFSTEDFDETEKPINLNGSYMIPVPRVTPPSAPVFTEVYAPRSALYEALPGFLLRLNGEGLAEDRLRSPDSPVWFRLSDSTGSHAPDHATVGAEYNFNRLTAQVGLDVAISENLTGSVSLRRVTGSADVSAPTGGGDNEARGIGASLEVSWRGANDYYANGGFSLTDYDMDIISGDRSVGVLEKDATARVEYLAIEAGRRFQLNEKMNLTPRAWLARSGVSMDKFTDAVNSRVSFTDAVSFTGGVGVVTETARSWESRTSSLRGWLDIELTPSGAETFADVSGEKLESKSSKNRYLLSLGGDYRMGNFSTGGEVSVGSLGSDDSQFASQLYVGMHF